MNHVTVLGLHIRGKIPTHTGEMTATKHARQDGFGYSCILASVKQMLKVNKLSSLGISSGKCVSSCGFHHFTVNLSFLTLCPSVTDTLVTSRVTDIPRVLRGACDTAQAHTPAYLEPAMPISQTTGSSEPRACCCSLHCSKREKKSPVMYHPPQNNNNN